MESGTDIHTREKVARITITSTWPHTQGQERPPEVELLHRGEEVGLERRGQPAEAQTDNVHLRVRRAGGHRLRDADALRIFLGYVGAK